MTQQEEHVPAEGTTAATQPGSTVKGAPTSNLDVEALKPLLTGLIQEEVKRSTQSVKDRRINQLEKRQDNFESRLERFNELVSEGFSQKQALRLMQLLDEPETEDVDPQVPPKAVAGTQQPPGAGKAIESILSDLGLSPSSPDVIAVLRDTDDLASQLERFSALAKKKREAQERPANPAQLLGAAGGSTPPDELAETTTRLEQAISAPSKLTPKELDELLKKQEALVKKNI